MRSVAKGVQLEGAWPLDPADTQAAQAPAIAMAAMLKPDEAGLEEAGRRLRAGTLVAFPTGVYRLLPCWR